MARLLVVDDDTKMASAIAGVFQREGHMVHTAHCGSTGVAAALEGQPDLIVLDLGLPEIDGFQLLQRIRDEEVLAPVLVLTGRSGEADRILSFQLGADQFLQKPFSVLELKARVNILLRRHYPGVEDVEPAPERITFGDIEIDTKAMVVTKRGNPVHLPTKEYGLLFALARAEGRIVSRAQLLEGVWGYSHAVPTRTIDTHIGQLRKKLEDDSRNPKYIFTVYKRGYRLAMDDATDGSS